MGGIKAPKIVGTAEQYGEVESEGAAVRHRGRHASPTGSPVERANGEEGPQVVILEQSKTNIQYLSRAFEGRVLEFI